MTSKNICFTLGFWVELARNLGFGFSVLLNTNIPKKISHEENHQRPDSLQLPVTYLVEEVLWVAQLEAERYVLECQLVLVPVVEGGRSVGVDHSQLFAFH